MEQAFSQAPEFLQHLKQSSLANIYKGLTFKALESPGALASPTWIDSSSVTVECVSKMIQHCCDRV
jgi:hypothetical protein